MNRTLFGSGIPMVGFITIKWSKLDWKLNGRSISGPVLKSLFEKLSRFQMFAVYSDPPNTEPWSVFGLDLMPVPSI
jgi:hypothetical protein